MTTAPKVYTARVDRSDHWWLITVDGVPFAHTQTRRFDQVEAIVRDLLVDLGVELDASAFSVRVINASDDVVGLVNEVIEARRKAAVAAAGVSVATAGAIVRLRDDGYSLRDIGALLDLSYQRVQQIERAARENPRLLEYTGGLVN